MKKIFSIEEVKRIENFEFKKRGNSFSLMVDAGVNCAKKIIKLIKKQSIVVVCGPGNNGGDGFILAEYLRSVRVLLIILSVVGLILWGVGFIT